METKEEKEGKEEMNAINNTARKWMIISWAEGNEASGYGKLLGIVEGTYEEAAEQARGIDQCSDLSPIGVCVVIE